MVPGRAFRAWWLSLLIMVWGGTVPWAAPQIEGPILLTQVPRRVSSTATGWEAKSWVRHDWFHGARLAVVSADGQVRPMSEGFHSACDPSLSFDGQRILFAAKKDPAALWRIYEMGIDGSGLRPVSPDHLDARSPIYVSTLFTLDSPEPWFTTVFVGRDRAAAGTNPGLFNVKLDGTELRKLTYHPSPSFDPFQMWDGRVIYTAVRQPIGPDSAAPRASLFAIHIEGADMELYGGEQGRRVQQMACATGKGLVVFVESDEATPDGAGQLSCVKENRPHVTYRRLTNDSSWGYLHPSPWRDNLLLVSRRSADGKDTWGVVAFDADQGTLEPVFDSPDYHDLQATLIRPRSRPDGHSTVVNTAATNGTFYCLNAYDADERMRPHLSGGLIKRVRLIEGLPEQTGQSSGGRAQSAARFGLRRLIGEAPVEADGSFNVEVPANTPVLLQTLDERGLALATCGWTWVQPKETRGCIGCHEDPERIPENEYALALRRPSNRLLLPPAQRRSVGFREQIVPILRSHCATADCHGGDETPLRLPSMSKSPTESELRTLYAALTVPAEAKTNGLLPPPGKYLDAGRARTSWLIWQLLGTNTARPWDQGAKPPDTPARKIRQMPPPGQSTPLSPEELTTFIQWIDLGAPLEAPRSPENKQPAVNR